MKSHLLSGVKLGERSCGAENIFEFIWQTAVIFSKIVVYGLRLIVIFALII